MSDAVQTGNASEGGDLEKVLAACRDRLPASTEWTAFTGYPNSLALAVIDAIWSVGTRYAITTGVISRYTFYRQRMGGDATHDGLTDLLGLYDHLGGIDAFIDKVGTRNRVSTQPGATLKGAAVHQAATAVCKHVSRPHGTDEFWPHPRTGGRRLTLAPDGLFSLAAPVHQPLTGPAVERLSEPKEPGQFPAIVATR